jgi:hypothetical protein
MPNSRCSWDASSFTATAAYTGENRLVTVEGSGECPQGGFLVELVPGNAGINPDPTELVLEIRETPPEVGTAVITPHSIEGVFEVSQEVRRVVIRSLDVELDLTEPA